MDKNNYFQPQISSQQQEHSALGIAGMIIGIVAILLSCIAIGGFIGIVGLVLSIIGITQKGKKSGMAIAGITLNALAIVIMVIILFAYAQNLDESSNATQEIVSEVYTPSKEVENIQTESIPTETQTKKKFPTVGNTIESDTWKITLLDAKQYDNIPSEFYTDEPSDGNKYLVLFFEVENISDKDDYFNYFYIESYLDGYSTDIEIIMNKPEGYSNLSGDVAAGKKLKGCLVYEVPISGWSELEMSYKNWIATSKKVATFLVTPDDLSE